MRSEIIKLHKSIKTTTIYVTHDQTEAMTMADRIVVMSNGYVQQIGTPYEIYKHPANKFVASFIGSPAMNFVDAKLDGKTLKFSDGFEIVLEKNQIDEINEFYKKLLPTKEKEFLDLEEEAKSIDTSKKMKKESVDLLDKIKKCQSDIALIKESLEGKQIDLIFGIRPESIKLSDEKDAFEKNIVLSELLGDEYYIHIDFGGKDVLAKISSETQLKAGESIRLSIKTSNIHLFDPITKNTIF